MKKQHKTKQKPKIAKTILNNKRTAEGLIIPNFKLYFIAIVKKKKKHGIGVKADMLLNKIKLKTLTYIQTPMNTCFLKSRIQKYILGKR